VTELLDRFEAARSSGRKLLVPYIVGGIPDRSSFGQALAAIQEHADAVEVGLPYSDPLMDGPVIALAAERALRDGTGPLEAMSLAAAVPGDVPRLAMTYFNPIHRLGEDQFCELARRSGFDGLIVPDLPHEESGSLRLAAASHDLAWVPLVAPTSSPDRVKEIAATCTGFVYAVSTLGVTGTRDALSERAARVVELCRQATDLPVLVGIGVSNPDQAQAAARIADGVVIGSAVVRTVIDEGASATAAFLASVRTALDTLRV
jgi:tryptophan synthase alpha chain